MDWTYIFYSIFLSYSMVSKKLSKYIWFGLQSFREEDDIPRSPQSYDYDLPDVKFIQSLMSM